MTDAENAALVEKWQCPGCAVGSDTQCGSYDPLDGRDYGVSCKTWAPGTVLIPGGVIALGLPVGFNKGHQHHRDGTAIERPITTLWMNRGTAPVTLFDALNVPVWAKDEDGACLVRVFSPRTNQGCVIVFEGRTRAEIAPDVFNPSGLDID